MPVDSIMKDEIFQAEAQAKKQDQQCYQSKAWPTVKRKQNLERVVLILYPEVADAE